MSEKIFFLQKMNFSVLPNVQNLVFSFPSMHYFEYHKKIWESMIHAWVRYPWLFHAWLSDESIEVRYYLLEYLRKNLSYIGTLEKDEEERPVPIYIKKKAYYWSVSHSFHYVAFSLSDTLTGIDIAEIEARDDTLFATHSEEEYRILWGVSWLNFYRLWTAKEAIIKASGWKLDDMSEIELREISEDSISIFGFREKIYKIKTDISGSMMLSYIYS